MAILGFFAIIAGNNVPSLNLFGNLGTIPGEITYRTQIVIIFKYSGPSNTIPPFTAHPDLYYFQVLFGARFFKYRRFPRSRAAIFWG